MLEDYFEQDDGNLDMCAEMGGEFFPPINLYAYIFVDI